MRQSSTPCATGGSRATLDDRLVTWSFAAIRSDQALTRYHSMDDRGGGWAVYRPRRLRSAAPFHVSCPGKVTANRLDALDIDKFSVLIRV